MMQFKSEISYALLSIILVIFGSIIGLGIIEKDIIILMITGLSFCLPLSVFLRTYYKIQGDTLLVVSGMLYRKEFSISEIKKIEATNSWISSPALSMNRIELFFNRCDSVIISPKNQQLFIEMLLTRNPSIVVLVNRSNA